MKQKILTQGLDFNFWMLLGANSDFSTAKNSIHVHVNQAGANNSHRARASGDVKFSTDDIISEGHFLGNESSSGASPRKCRNTPLEEQSTSSTESVKIWVKIVTICLYVFYYTKLAIYNYKFMCPYMLALCFSYMLTYIYISVYTTRYIPPWRNSGYSPGHSRTVFVCFQLFVSEN